MKRSFGAISILALIATLAVVGTVGAASPIKGNVATRLFQAQRLPLPVPPSGRHSRLYAQFEVRVVGNGNTVLRRTPGGVMLCR